MPNWDEDSPQLRENLARVLEEIARQAELRAAPTIEAARQWQSRVMEGRGYPMSDMSELFEAAWPGKCSSESWRESWCGLDTGRRRIKAL
jgi:hypothetical protein